MTTANTTQVYVFPLGDMVFFPSTSVPLNIFEPRYLKMVKDAIATGTPLALCGTDPTEAAEGTIVAGMGKPRIVHRRADGTLIILVQGVTRVRLGAVVRPKPYIVCEASVVALETEIAVDGRRALRRVAKVFAAWIDRHVRGDDDKRYLTGRLRDPVELCEHAATLMIDDASLKQLVLETDDLETRAHLINAAFLPDGTPTPARLSHRN